MTHSKLKGENVNPFENMFYKRIMEQAPDIILVVRLDGQIWDANEAASLGYGYSIEELKALRIQDLHTKDTGEAVKNQWRGTSQSPLVYRTNHLRNDGEGFPVEMRCQHTSFQDKDLFIIIIRNMTEVKNLENAIQVCNHERDQLVDDWTNLFQKAPGGYHSLHLDGNFIYINETELKWLGYRREEVVGILRFEDVLTEKSRLVYQDCLTELMRTGQVVETDVEMVRKDGSVFPVLISTVGIKDESGIYSKSLSTCMDITERKLWEEGIVASENQYRALAENSNDLIARFDGECRYLYVNPAIGPIAGIPQEIFIGKTNEELELPRAFCVIIRHGIKGVFNKGRSIQRELEHFVAGRRMIFHLQLVPEFHTDGSIASVLCVGRDITKLKKAEQEHLYGYERRRRRELLNDVINRRISQEELVAGAAQLQMKIKPPFVILLLAFPWSYLPPDASIEANEDRQYSIEILVDNIQRQGRGVTWQTQEGVAILHPMPGTGANVSLKQAKIVAEEIVAKLSPFWQGVNICGGISHSSEGTPLIADVYDQARVSFLCSPVLYPENTLHYWEELGCYQFIFHDYTSKQAQQFVNYHLGMLLHPDGKGDQRELLATLKEIITGASAQVIGKRLFVHPQTVVFRKRNLEKMMSVDLDSLKVRMDLSVALKLLSLLRKAFPDIKS